MRLTDVHDVAHLDDRCEGFNISIFPLASGSPRLRAEGPLGTASRATSHREGVPLLARPDGRLIVDEGELVLDVSGVPLLDPNICPTLITAMELGSGAFGAPLKERVRKALANPTDEKLNKALDDLARGLSFSLFTPATEDLLSRSVPLVSGQPLFGNPTRAVTLQLDASGRLRAVFEKPKQQGTTSP